MMEDRRRYVRVPENLQIAYEVIPAEQIKEYITKDISQGGIRFLAHDFIPKGSRLKIRISFPRTLFSFEAMVECMWIRQLPYGDEFEVGVEFINLPSEVLDYLISYIRVSMRNKTQQLGG